MKKLASIKQVLRAPACQGIVALARQMPCAGPPRRYALTVLKLDRLGDAVLSLGAVRRLVSHAGARHTLLVVSEVAAPLYEMEFPEVDKLVLPAFCQRFWPDLCLTLLRHAGRLRQIQTKHLVCLRHPPSDYLHAISQVMQVEQCHASRWNLSWERTSLAYPSCQTTSYPENAPDGTCLELEAHRRVVEGLLGTPVAADEIRPAFSSIQARPGTQLLVCPLAGDALRQYPPALMARAVRLFLDHRPQASVGVCLPPGADHAPWAEAFRAESVGIAQWISPKNIPQLVEVIAGAGVLLCPDSAPAHIATALDKPGVFILGGGHHGMFAPWRRSERQRWLSHAMPCYQCRWNCHQAEPFCITHLPAQEVADALLAVHLLRQK
ncbi:MAG: hypothetical protein HS117_18850 [Verrucomicrobiaceae bacterium]|nr:hypothetical protein [Verrucomicrobiaceae bacterium]